MSKILVIGSLAYDYIMHFGSTFAKHILPDKLNMLNVSFTAHAMSKDYGGTAGNIAYGLSLLKVSPFVFASAGEDFQEYSKWLEDKEIDTSTICIHQNHLTASAHIITDKNANQITAFHGGAMLQNDISIIPLLEKNEITMAIIAADGKTGMLRHSKELKEKNIPYIYDPGHSLPSFNGEEILQLLVGSFITIVNKYEKELLLEKTGKTLEEVVAAVQYLIVTQGDEGSILYHKEGQINIAAAKVGEFKDPTGAGDAYRAGLLKGLQKNFSIEICGKLASIAACYAVECSGTQNYEYTLDEFKKRYIENYGGELEI